MILCSFVTEEFTSLINSTMNSVHLAYAVSGRSNLHCDENLLGITKASRKEQTHNRLIPYLSFLVSLSDDWRALVVYLKCCLFVQSKRYC